MKKIVSGFMALVLFATLLAGCSSTIKTKVYSNEKVGISVEMPVGMTEKEILNFTYYLEGLKVIFAATNVEKSAAENLEINSLEDMFDYLCEQKKKEYKLEESDGLKYFFHEETADGKDFFYLAALKETDGAYWICEMACLKSDKSKYQDKFVEWAKTIKLTK